MKQSLLFTGLDYRMDPDLSPETSHIASSPEPEQEGGDAHLLGTSPILPERVQYDAAYTLPEFSEQLQELLPLDKRGEYLGLVRSQTTGSEPPEGYTEISLENFEQLKKSLPHLTESGLKELVATQNDTENGFDSSMYVDESGEVYLVMGGSKDLKDLKTNAEIYFGEQIPEQAMSALDAYKHLQELTQKEPTALGFSLGGYLAQVMPKGVNFSGPGAEDLKKILVEEGVYQSFGLDEQSTVVNVGSESDPIYNFLGAERTSGHVTGKGGGTFHLRYKPDEGSVINLENHYKFWDELATSEDVVSNGDLPHFYDSALKRSVPWLLSPGTFDPNINDDLHDGQEIIKVDIEKLFELF